MPQQPSHEQVIQKLKAEGYDLLQVNNNLNATINQLAQAIGFTGGTLQDLVNHAQATAEKALGKKPPRKPRA